MEVMKGSGHTSVSLKGTTAVPGDANCVADGEEKKDGLDKRMDQARKRGRKGKEKSEAPDTAGYQVVEDDDDAAWLRGRQAGANEHTVEPVNDQLSVCCYRIFPLISSGRMNSSSCRLDGYSSVT